MEMMKAYILAGGRSKRMGQDKALLQHGDAFVIERVIAAIPGRRQDIFLLTNTPDKLAFLGLKTLPDVHPGLGPLAGIHAGLLDSNSAFSLFVACDLPLIRPETITQLISNHRKQLAFALRSEKGPESLCAIFSKACLPTIEGLIAQKDYSVRTLLSKVRAEFFSIKDSSELLNLNSPEDFRQFVTIIEKKDP